MVSYFKFIALVPAIYGMELLTISGQMIPSAVRE
jgi:hypothetical protein